MEIETDNLESAWEGPLGWEELEGSEVETVSFIFFKEVVSDSRGCLRFTFSDSFIIFYYFHDFYNIVKIVYRFEYFE